MPWVSAADVEPRVGKLIADNNWEVINLDTGFERNKMYLDEIKHFIDYIQGLITEPLVSLRDGVKVLQIALAAKESTLMGKIITP